MADHSTAIIQSDEDWEAMGEATRHDMMLFDALPQVLRDLMNDVPVDFDSVMKEWRWYINQAPLLERRRPERQLRAAGEAAAEIRRLATKAHEQDLAEGAAELAANARRILPKAHRRS